MYTPPALRSFHSQSIHSTFAPSWTFSLSFLWSRKQRSPQWPSLNSRAPVATQEGEIESGLVHSSMQGSSLPGMNKYDMRLWYAYHGTRISPLRRSGRCFLRESPGVIPRCSKKPPPLVASWCKLQIPWSCGIAVWLCLVARPTKDDFRFPSLSAAPSVFASWEKYFIHVIWLDMYPLGAYSTAWHCFCRLLISVTSQETVSSKNCPGRDTRPERAGELPALSCSPLPPKRQQLFRPHPQKTRHQLFDPTCESLKPWSWITPPPSSPHPLPQSASSAKAT